MAGQSCYGDLRWDCVVGVPFPQKSEEENLWDGTQERGLWAAGLSFLVPSPHFLYLCKLCLAEQVEPTFLELS